MVSAENSEPEQGLTRDQRRAASTSAARLQAGETVVQTGKAHDMKVLLLAAPTQEGVETLIRSQKALWQ